MYIAALFFILFRQVFNAYLERHRETVLICYLAIRALLCSEGNLIKLRIVTEIKWHVLRSGLAESRRVQAHVLTRFRTEHWDSYR